MYLMVYYMPVKHTIYHTAVIMQKFCINDNKQK
nr:MAG TPA: hypothetical protein [Caudoviricetes sp.]